MLETGNETMKQPRMTLRISDTSLAFAIADKTAVKGVAHETYTVRSGISIAANLREAFRQSQLLSHPTGRAQVMLSAPTMLVPVEEFDETKAETLYRYSFAAQANTEVICSVLPQLNAVAIMAINRDLMRSSTTIMPTSSTCLSSNPCGAICTVAPRLISVAAFMPTSTMAV